SPPGASPSPREPASPAPSGPGKRPSPAPSASTHAPSPAPSPRRPDSTGRCGPQGGPGLRRSDRRDGKNVRMLAPYFRRGDRRFQHKPLETKDLGAGTDLVSTTSRYQPAAFGATDPRRRHGPNHQQPD